MSEPKIGRRAMAIYRFIVDYKRQNDGVSPSMREIGRGVGLNSTNTVSLHLNTLKDAGMITMIYADSRSIRVNGGRWVPPAIQDNYEALC